MIKRLLDILASAFGLLVVWPALLAAAVLIKLDSKGPVLFRQRRVGRGFKTFFILKLRTMAADAPARGGAITAGGDPRVTRVGRWLRRSKLDELPQLWNVLKGEMSLVGPRPEVPEFVEKFRADYEKVLTIRPGITDLASLRYRDEEAVLASYPDPEQAYIERILPDKIALAKRYVDTASLGLDARILLQTLVKVGSFRAALPVLLGTILAASAAAASFPIGIYGVRTPERVSELSRTGFDWVHYFGPPDGAPAFLKAARREGLAVLLPQESGSSEVKNDLPAAWYISDEPEIHGTSLKELQSKEAELRKVRPGARTALALGSGAAVEKYRDVGDVLMVDWYPVPHMALDSVADQLDTAKQAAGGKPVWMILQAFDWREYAQRDPKKERIGRFPSFSEIRLMTYLSLVHGADGLFYYTLHKRGGGDLMAWPEQWQALARVVREVAALRPALERGGSVAVSETDPGVEAKSWRQLGRETVIVLNRTPISRAFPEAFLGPQWRPLFEARRDPRDLLLTSEKGPLLRPYQVLVLERRTWWR